MGEDWRKIDRGLFESPDGRWRISNPWKLKVRHEAPCERRRWRSCCLIRAGWDCRPWADAAAW
jgi:hypothetical protein